MLGLTNLALLTYVLVIVGMVIGKLVPGSYLDCDIKVANPTMRALD
jgi:hypothetical protein